jgi:hypothetical protein
MDPCIHFSLENKYNFILLLKKIKKEQKYLLANIGRSTPYVLEKKGIKY